MNDAAKPRTDPASRSSEHARGASHGEGDDFYAQFEKDITKVKSDIARLSDQIADAVSTLGTIAQSNARRGMKRARVGVDELAASASERAGAAGGALSIVAKDTASSVGDTLSDTVEDRPLASLALAVAIGFLIGLIWRR
jgi:ElaB/YqjD/DUF883 family membrane-anchored ribosome-binding protein